MRGEQPRSYETAQICLNGHVRSSAMEHVPKPDAKLCETCGAALITSCPACQAQIRGVLWPPAGIGGRFPTPAFCHNCGGPYPWTAAKLQAAKDLAQELEDLSAQERTDLSRSLDDLVRDTPTTAVAATRFKRIIQRLGPGIADAFKTILVDVMSETAKKLLWP